MAARAAAALPEPRPGGVSTARAGLLAAGPSALERVARLLAARGETLAVAETSAAGLIAAALLAVPGASRWFLGSAVAYSPAARRAWLGLPADAFGDGGAVSEPAAVRLAAAVRDALGATWGLAETGIAGPQTGRRSRKPAGLAYLAVAGPTCVSQELQTRLDDRRANQAAFAAAALALLADALERAGSQQPAGVGPAGAAVPLTVGEG